MKTQSDLAPLVRALRAFRKGRHATQEEMADALGISRKTYILFESGRWFPTVRQRSHFVTELHSIDPRLSHAFVGVLEQTVEEHAIVVQRPAVDVVIEPKQAKAAFDAALYSTAEEADLSPKILRAVTASLLARLADAGLAMGQAVALAKAAAVGGTDPAKKRPA